MGTPGSGESVVMAKCETGWLLVTIQKVDRGSLASDSPQGVAIKGTGRDWARKRNTSSPRTLYKALRQTWWYPTWRFPTGGLCPSGKCHLLQRQMVNANFFRGKCVQLKGEQNGTVCEEGVTAFRIGDTGDAGAGAQVTLERGHR